MVMAKPAAQKQEAEELHGLIVRKGADKRFYVERVVLEGDKVLSRKVVADNFTFEALCLDATIRLRSLLGEVFHPIVKR